MPTRNFLLPALILGLSLVGCDKPQTSVPEPAQQSSAEMPGHQYRMAKVRLLEHLVDLQNEGESDTDTSSPASSQIESGVEECSRYQQQARESDPWLFDVRESFPKAVAEYLQALDKHDAVLAANADAQRSADTSEREEAEKNISASTSLVDAAWNKSENLLTELIQRGKSDILASRDEAAIALLQTSEKLQNTPSQ
jgi:hypothetical protein